MKIVGVACAIGLSAGAAFAHFSTDFELGDGGLSGTGDWAYGMPSGFNTPAYGGPEPLGGFSGDFAWGTVLGGSHNPSTISTLTLSGLDLTTLTELSFYEWIQSGGNTFDTARVFVGGTQVYLSDGDSASAWREVSIDLTGFTGTQDIEWVFTATALVDRVGWYIDDVSVIPAPAGAAILAFGGLVGMRRRRG